LGGKEAQYLIKQNLHQVGRGKPVLKNGLSMGKPWCGMWIQQTLLVLKRGPQKHVLEKGTDQRKTHSSGNPTNILFFQLFEEESRMHENRKELVGTEEGF